MYHVKQKIVENQDTLTLAGYSTAVKDQMINVYPKKHGVFAMY